jgi:hypothetical protein
MKRKNLLMHFFIISLKYSTTFPFAGRVGHFFQIPQGSYEILQGFPLV